MEDLAEAILDSLILEPVLEAIQKRLGTKKGDREAFRIRSTAEGIYRLGGLPGLQAWLDVRLGESIGSSDELTELRLIRNNVRYHFKRSENKLRKRCDEDKKRRDYEMLWANLLIGRDLQKRASELKFNADPRQAILKRLQAAGVVA